MKASRQLPYIFLLFFSSIFCNAQNMERVDTLNAARVTSDLIRHKEISSQTGLQKIDASKIKRGFALFNTPDIIKTLQMMPGVSSGTELLSGLYVHGGDGSDNLFLLDGVPIYQVSHMVGLFSSFNSDVVDEVDFYKSGFPARYGGRMSSVVDVNTRDGDMEEYHGTFALGLIDGRLQLEGPLVKGKASFNVGIRRTWNEVVTVPALIYANKSNNEELERAGDGEKESFYAGYNFTDFNARLTHLFSDRNRLSLSFYGGEDRLPASYTSTDYTIGSDGKKHFGDTSIKGKLSWGNFLTSAKWEHISSERFHTDVTLYRSVFHGIIDAKVRMWEWDGADLFGDVNENVSSKVALTGLNAQGGYLPGPNHNIRFGAMVQNKNYRPERSYYVSMGDIKDSGEAGPHFSGTESALYAEDEMGLTSWLKINAGLRVTAFSINGKVWMKLEPRASAKMQIGDNSSFRVSYTEMNQFDHIISTTYLDLPTNTWMPSTAVIKPMFSRQFATGLYSSPRKGLNLTLEGWYKTMDNMYEYGGPLTIYPPVDRWETDFVEGKGRSYGMETAVEYENEKITASAYYTLSWSLRNFPDFYAYWYPDRNDNRHKIDLLANYRFGAGFELYAGWHYHTGNNITVASYLIRYPESSYFSSSDSLYDKPNSLKLPDYHRLDLGLNFKKRTKRGNEAIWNLSIYNVYCRMNAIYGEVYSVYEDYEDEEGIWRSRATGENRGRAYGLIPIIPTLGYTLNF